ncbi:T-box transcription factor TBX21 [Acipenser ruthenus]|uniref:T-box transcription factor TBX21 n=1 Tax=Acipenser ruthenus TaxID=7906 RepID=UPI0027409E3C|nr:T-box transcription factor TBX21 [Acipenser ruthenus]
MLNGTEAISFGKEAETVSHHHPHHNKDPSELKMGIQDARFLYQEPNPTGLENCSLALPYSSQTLPGSQSGRFFTSAALNSCHYNPMRSPSAGGGGQPYTAPGSEVCAAPGGEMYPPSSDGYPSSLFHHGYPRALLEPLPGFQVCGKTQAVLNNYPLWAKFHQYQTEMIITKQGRRMFPYLSFNITALDPTVHYNVYVDVVLADQHHWRYQGGKWVQCGKAECNMPGNRRYMHPDSPNSGAHWMRQEISFGKLKLTNNKGGSNNTGQMIVLQSLHKYQPQLHIVEVKEDSTEEPHMISKTQTFTFPETQFIAVTAYQNADITQLKIDHNPFAKGFRDNFDAMYGHIENDRLTPSPTDATGCQQLLSSGCYPQSYRSEPYLSPLQQNRYYSHDRATVGLPGQAKEPGVSSSSPHSRWYHPGQQTPTTANRLDFSSYESNYAANAFVSYKPFPIQTSAHHPLGYYPEHPFGSSTASGAWGSSRPTSQYHHHHHHKPGLSWFRPAPTHPSVALELQQGQPTLPAPQQDKAKEAGGEDSSWLEPPSVKSVDSADSGLFEGAESKKRRVSPYASSTESSPPNRAAEACERDCSGDAGYYGFYTN